MSISCEGSVFGVDTEGVVSGCFCRYRKRLGGVSMTSAPWPSEPGGVPSAAWPPAALVLTAGSRGAVSAVKSSLVRLGCWPLRRASPAPGDSAVAWPLALALAFAFALALGIAWSSGSGAASKVHPTIAQARHPLGSKAGAGKNRLVSVKPILTRD